MDRVSGRVLSKVPSQACGINIILSPGIADTALIKATLLPFILKYRREQPPFSKVLLSNGRTNHGWLKEEKRELFLPPYPSMKCIWAHGGKFPAIRDGLPRTVNWHPCSPVYLMEMGFSHVEFLPVMEHPFYGSWGYQTVGYFAPTSRYGKPDDFKYLIDYLHRNGIGVILDWVPSHFPSDQHGLGFFDGTHLYEHANPKQGFHPEWTSLIFNYGRVEVQSFLISNAIFWLDVYHADGLRVDGVASMLYLDYARRAGEWIPNRFGGKENLEALSFLRKLNEAVYRYYPDVQTIAEESTAWPNVTRPTYTGGVGFGLKWNLGWMHDTLRFFSKDPVHRSHHMSDLTFSLLYAYSENFVLCLSHDEVVHGKGSLYNRMPGDEWQKLAEYKTSLRVYVYSSREKAPFHGKRVRTARGVGLP